MNEYLEYMQSRFENAIIEFEEWLGQNNLSIDALFGSNLAHISNTMQSTSNTTSGIKSYNKLSEITQVFEQAATLSFIAKNQGKELNFVDPSKGFGDIYNSKTKSAAELKLIAEVETHLPPQEKEKAIANNTKASTIMSSVKQAIDTNQQKFVQLLLNEKQKTHKESVQKDTKEKEIQSEGKMNSLGDPFGVLAEITKNMRLIVENRNQNITKDKKSPPSKEQSFDAQVSSALKNMGKDPNLAQQRQQQLAK